MNPKRCVITGRLNPRDYYIFSIDICHGSEISTEDGNMAFVAVKANSKKSDYSWCNLDVGGGGFSDSKI